MNKFVLNLGWRVEAMACHLLQEIKLKVNMQVIKFNSELTKPIEANCMTFIA